MGRAPLPRSGLDRPAVTPAKGNGRPGRITVEKGISLEIHPKSGRHMIWSLHFSIRTDHGLVRVGLPKNHFIEMELGSWNSERLSYNRCARSWGRTPRAPLGSGKLTSARLHPFCSWEGSWPGEGSVRAGCSSVSFAITPSLFRGTVWCPCPVVRNSCSALWRFDRRLRSARYQSFSSGGRHCVRVGADPYRWRPFRSGRFP